MSKIKKTQKGKIILETKTNRNANKKKVVFKNLTIFLDLCLEIT